MHKNCSLSLAVCFVVALAFLGAACFVFSSDMLYVALVGIVALAAGLSWLWSTRIPAHALQALQVFWWTVLVAIGYMVAVDAQVYADSGLPAVVYIPPIAPAILKSLISLRASAVYGAGVALLLIPSAAIYNEWDEGLVLLAVAVAGMLIVKSKPKQIGGDIMDALRDTEVKAKQAADAINKRT